MLMRVVWISASVPSRISRSSSFRRRTTKSRMSTTPSPRAEPGMTRCNSASGRRSRNAGFSVRYASTASSVRGVELSFKTASGRKT